MRKFKIEIKWGILFMLLMLTWMFFEKLMGWHDEKIAKHHLLTNLFSIPAIGFYILALLDKRKNYYQGSMTWLQGFSFGVLIAFIVALLSPLTQYITLKFITPHYFENIINHAVAIGEMTRVQAKEYFTLGNYILQSIIGALAMGTITSAILSIFLRKQTTR